ncbi:hypothetical protein Kim5_CH00789 [Rhizobium sp. Kim5]|uniref:hypothetical protein n=1 Tax=Rhizobium sp. Kim5 TaxID=2020311 RepID=UPI000A2A1F8E|nr:hypothetical protein [Rhizobium sp. Kim5]ARQ56897.1 hypothetical protein Kim5_CH00789 [Rhizobium sp. Kim5]
MQERMQTRWGRPWRHDDAQLADQLELEVNELRSRLPYESDREREHILDDIARIERTLCNMCC